MKILIASTPKTGNTWLRLLLSQIYDLPSADIPFDFSETAAAALGPRWVTHQHLLPERVLLRWTRAQHVHLLTTVRDPADTLVSLYHYCCNYPDHYNDDAPIVRALAADAADRQKAAAQPHHVLVGELIRTLQDRLMCDLNVSISWIRSGRTIVVRYEELRRNPVATLSGVTP